MKNNIMKSSYKDLLIRGSIMFFFMGTYFSILQDKAVLAYFLKIETILQILFFTVTGGLLYAWSANSMIKLNKRKKAKNSEDKDNTDCQ